MMTVQWLPKARADIERLHTFIEPYNAHAAVRATDAIIEVADSLADFPEKGRPWDMDLDYRELPVRFGAKVYVIRYRFISTHVIIVRVWHVLEDR